MIVLLSFCEKVLVEVQKETQRWRPILLYLNHFFTFVSLIMIWFIYEENSSLRSLIKFLVSIDMCCLLLSSCKASGSWLQYLLVLLDWIYCLGLRK